MFAGSTKKIWLEVFAKARPPPKPAAPRAASAGGAMIGPEAGGGPLRTTWGRNREFRAWGLPKPSTMPPVPVVAAANISSPSVFILK
jgi:hypothetical protein